MSDSLTPKEIFDRSADEGKRRLDQSTLELIATGFIAGFTVVFGIIALGIVEALARPLLGDLAKLLGAMAFGIGVVFLILGRAELFSENFLDPIAAAFRSDRGMKAKLARLWAFTLIFNLVGGAVLVLVLSVEGALPSAASETLKRIAEEIAGRPPLVMFMRSIVGGALVALLSYLVIASRDSTGRILLAYATGVLLPLGPFNHIVVSLLHLAFAFPGGAVTATQVALVAAMSLAGNLLGGVGLVSLSHVAQARGADE